MTCIVAIVGSRYYTNYDTIERIVDGLHLSPTCIVSGGARGVDTLAERYAQNRNIPCQVFTPDWKRFGKGAGIMRNTDIVASVNVIVAFPSKDSKGTFDTINKARKKGIIVHIHYVD